MKKVKISFKNLNTGSIFLYLFLILISSLLIVAGLISLPLTENFREDISYDLVTKDPLYWGKEYILELDTTTVLDSEKEEMIDNTRDILFKRLNSSGIEEVSVYGEQRDDKDIVRVVVKTSKDESLVDNLVQNRFFVTVVTRKEDVDFEDEENQYAYLLGENYNKTEFTGESFRNVLITKLKNSSGEYSYFAVFKPWMTKEKGFQEFLAQHENETIGVDIDGFVTPYYVPATNPKTFAIPITGGDSQAELIDKLYNSGEIPLSYTTTETNSLEVNNFSLNYIELSIALLSAVILVHLILIYVLKEDTKDISQSLFSVLLTISLWIAYLKIFAIPVDIWLLAIETVLITLIIYLLTHNKESQVGITTSLLLSSFVLMTTGIGYMRIFGQEMIILVILCQACIAFSKWYIANMKKVLLK